MKRLILVALCLMVIATPATAQLVNPRAINGSYTSTLNTESPQTISLVSKYSTRDLPALFMYKFTVSDSCRIVFHNTSLDTKVEDSDITGVRSGLDDYVLSYIPIEANKEYSFNIRATSMTIFRAGASVPVVYSGVVEYE